MVLADWIGKDTSGRNIELVLADDYVFEGSKSLRIPSAYDDYFSIVHKQTIADAPVSGAVKTAYLETSKYNGYPGAVFKYQDAENFIAVYVNRDGAIELVKWVDGRDYYPAYVDFPITLDLYKWYILEAVCDDENNTITARVKDANENVIAEAAFSDAIPSEFKGKGGGIGLYGFSDDRLRFDLTKIYYP